MFDPKSIYIPKPVEAIRDAPRPESERPKMTARPAKYALRGDSSGSLLSLACAEIYALIDVGYRVRRITQFQYRINETLDLYPVHRRWHDISLNRRGRYGKAADIAGRKLKA